ncbi:hypothetical protein CORC01_05695 [Colletotrichum orchidophilum]|uniref:Tetrahydrofolate dehydrogenase/cyclohydrolase catalytic domain-containing protein n=1 Tax=Colletotrichum orchidophilum TaxID=1209926 RepID=A0A1G4BCC8_9PEZI|nr:uncharacterized protein CORC01_05695 [Colletotrichum orchidophilum]OHE99005.1 hypothetical protein CORC01_05695 [Colletotrichum orchidophilum]
MSFNVLAGGAIIDEKHDLQPTFDHLTSASLLKGFPVAAKVERWCYQHRSRDDIEPTLGVIYFDTGNDAKEYLQIKAEVAAKAGIRYISHRLPPDASVDETLDKIAELNEDENTHAILVQRPLPNHLEEHEIMDSIHIIKHIEEFAKGYATNIAVDALRRLLDAYHKAWMLDLTIVLLGGTNIITPGFKADLKRHLPHVDILEMLGDGMSEINPQRHTVVMTELNKGGIIKPSMIGPGVKLIVDLGFDVITKMGDLYPGVHDIRDLVVVPTPGGVLPVIIWLMMERTIKAKACLKSSRSCCLLGAQSGCTVS